MGGGDTGVGGRRCVAVGAEAMDRYSEAAGLAGGRLGAGTDLLEKRGRWIGGFLSKCSENERLRKRSKGRWIGGS